MTKLRHYFGEIELTWIKVIIFSILAGAYTALVCIIPGIYDTSFHDIAVDLDVWFLLAMFIIMNSKTWKEASLKTFVFFLISQPLVYLIQVPWTGWQIFMYYRYWFIFTLLTLPGAVVAFQVKKQNWLSVLILSVATCFLAFESVNYLKSTLTSFPNHLLSSILSLAIAIFFIFCFLKEKKQKIVALILVIAVLAGSFMYYGIGMGGNTMELELEEGTWTYENEDDSIITCEMLDDNHAKLTLKREGTTFITFTNEKGEEVEYCASVSGYDIFLSEME